MSISVPSNPKLCQMFPAQQLFASDNTAASRNPFFIFRHEILVLRLSLPEDVTGSG